MLAEPDTGIRAVVTQHAIDRFRSRICRCGEAEARQAILASLRTIGKVRASRRDSRILMGRTKEPFALRVMIAHLEGEDLPHVVTVMPGRRDKMSPSDRRYRGQSKASHRAEQEKLLGRKVLRVRAYLPAGYAASDDWSPSLDGILAYWTMRERLGEERFALNSADVMGQVMIEDLPLARQEFEGQWWWLASSPIAEEHARYYRYYHRRFNDMAAERYLPEGQKKVLTTAGPYKEARLRHVVRVTPHVTWHCIGDEAEIIRLLDRCTHIGRGFSAGMGRVSRWEVTEAGADAWLAMFHRPLPYTYAYTHGCEGIRMRWGLRPPIRHPSLQVECMMPVKRTSGDAQG